MHKAQTEFCKLVKQRFPHSFKNCTVLDGGSLDINGNNRHLFEECQYTGIDLGEGSNVDIVSMMHEHKAPDGHYDTIISTEAFEHDMHFTASITNLIRMLRSKGLLLFTCGTEGRTIHGTEKKDYKLNSSPFTRKIPGWENFYKNLTEQDVRKVIDVDRTFLRYAFEVSHITHDLYFWGVKR